MSFLIYFACGFVAAFIQMLIKDSGIITALASIITIDSSDLYAVALTNGFLSGAVALILYGTAFWVARKLINQHEVKSFRRDAMRAGMTPFEYAKRITAPSVIEYCESNLEKPTHIVTGYLDKLADDKVIKRPCADVLIEGYESIMRGVQLKATLTAQGIRIPSTETVTPAREPEPPAEDPPVPAPITPPPPAQPSAYQAPPPVSTPEPPVYNSGLRYCKRCGKPINSTAKKCTGCGKQYFTFRRHAIWIVPAVIVMALAGYVAFNYTQAEKAVEQEQFVIAKQYLDNLLVFDDLFPDTYAMAQAGALAEEGHYIEALQYFRAAGGSDISEEVLDTLINLVYANGQYLYRADKFEEAQAHFDEIPHYKRSSDYSQLISCAPDTTRASVLCLLGYDDLIKMIDFENTGEILLRHAAQKFLTGRWEGGKYYFEIERSEDGATSYYNLPHKDVEGYYSFDNGVYFEGPFRIFRFEIIDEDTISVYCYKDGSRYTLYRQ